MPRKKQTNSPLSSVYNSLVKSETDFLGIVAYSIYKADKVEFITNYMAQNGYEPNKLEISNFVNSRSSERMLKGYRVRANDFVFSYCSEVIQTFVKENKYIPYTTISTEFINLLDDFYDNRKIEGSYVEDLKNFFNNIHEKKHKKSFWRNVLASMVASVALAFIMLLIILYLTYREHSFLEILKDIITNIQIKLHSGVQ
jgi:hypothetical protein